MLASLAACGGYDGASDGGSPITDAPGLGACELAATASYPSGPWPRGVVVADLNADAHLDLVIPSEDDLMRVMYGTSSGAFIEGYVMAGARPIAIAVGDFTEDGRVDIAVSGSPTMMSPAVSILEGHPDGTFTRLPQSLPIAASHLVAADFDHDGHLDVVASSSSGIRVFPGSGTGTFTTSVPELMLGQTPTFEVADVDGDGLLDLIAVSSFKLVVRRSGPGTTIMYDTGGVYPRDLAIGDLDADTDLDLVVVNGDDDTVRLFFNSGGSFETQSDLPTDIPPGSDGAGTGSGSNVGSWLPRNAAIGDFTADGVNDVMVLIEPYLPTTDESKMLVLERSANMSFSQHPCSMAIRPVGVVAGNFVGDARTDAIIVAAPYNASSGGAVMIVQQAP